MAALILSLLVSCSWVDANDCAVAPPGTCEPYRPGGLLCGLVHTGWSWNTPPDDYAGALCTVGGETTNPGQEGRERCPDGLLLADGVVDDESSAPLRSCVWPGNAERSSASMSDVPDGLACGFNMVGDTLATRNHCGDHDPLEGECPPGFELRFARDLTSNCLPDEDLENEECDPRPPAGTSDTGEGCAADDREAHLLVWCEAVDGCVEGECALDFAGVCGLAPVGFNRLGGMLWKTIEREIACQSERLYAAYQEAYARELAAAAAGEPELHSCLGQDLPLDECPAGLKLTCTPECAGSGRGTVDDGRCGSVVEPMAGGLCWCTTPEAALNLFDAPIP